jgi:hypothetical protein
MKHVICGIDLADYQPGSININRVGMIEWGKYQSPRCLPSRSGSMYEFKTQPLAMTIETRESMARPSARFPVGISPCPNVHLRGGRIYVRFV